MAGAAYNPIFDAVQAKAPDIELTIESQDESQIIFNGEWGHITVKADGSIDTKVPSYARVLSEAIEAAKKGPFNEAATIIQPAVQKPASVPVAKPQSKSGFRPAQRRKAKLRLGISGPSGSGKTASSLLIAYGITGDWGKIGLIDTENGSGELYVGQVINGEQIGEYNVLPMEAPYGPEKYISGIKMAEEAGLEVVIIDSLSHAWAGEGGLLDQHGRIADSGKGNSWTAWRSVTPKHNALVEAMLTSKIHVIATMRAKTEHVQEKDEKGRTIIKKVGMAPIQREGMEYEMTTFLDIDIHHQANASKDRSNLFATDAYFKPTPEIGKKLKAWLEAA